MKILQEILYYDGVMSFLGTTGDTWGDQIWYCAFSGEELYPEYPPGRTYLCVSTQNDVAVTKRVTEEELR